jgi:hypothetical protein
MAQRGLLRGTPLRSLCVCLPCCLGFHHHHHHVTHYCCLGCVLPPFNPMPLAAALATTQNPKPCHALHLYLSCKQVKQQLCVDAVAGEQRFCEVAASMAQRGLLRGTPLRSLCLLALLLGLCVYTLSTQSCRHQPLATRREPKHCHALHSYPSSNHSLSSRMLMRLQASRSFMR